MSCKARARLIGVVAAGSVVVVNSPGWAQSGDAGTAAPDQGLAEIVVTAQKTAQNLQQTPIAVSVLGAESLAQRNITDVQAIAATIPNFTFSEYGGAAKIAIRGLGYDSFNPGAEARVAYYVDGIYVARPAAILGSFYDIDRIEVLRGPQGTLYGRNSTGGAVNVITNDPTESISGYYRQSFGNYGDRQEEGAVGGPIADGLGVRMSFSLHDNNGYGRNTLTDHDVDDVHSESVRLKVTYKPTDSFSLTGLASYHQERDANYPLHYLTQGNPTVPFLGDLFGGVVPSNPRDLAENYDPLNHRQMWDAALIAKYSISDGLQLNSLSGYHHTNYNVFYDVTGISGGTNPNSLGEGSNSYSEELQLVGKSRLVDWIGGLYFFKEDVNGYVSLPLSGVLFGGPNTLLQGYGAFGDLTTTSAAAFGQATFKLTSKLSATVGLRYGWERNSVLDGNVFNPSIPYASTVGPGTYRLPAGPYWDVAGGTIQDDSKNEYSLTPKFNVQYQITDLIQAYATAAKGYKSGGFDLGAAAPYYSPEKLWDYEGGVKATFFNNRLRTNLAGFYYKYSDLQVSLVTGNQILTQNAASAAVRGVEGEFTGLVTPELQVDLAGGFLNATFSQFSTSDPANPQLGVQDLRGNALAQAPRWSGTLGAQYSVQTRAGKFTLRGEGNYSSTTYFTPFNVNTNAQPSYAKANVFLNYVSPSGAWTGGLYGRNIFNRLTVNNAVTTAGFNGYTVVGYFDPPMTYGITGAFHF